MTTRYGIRRVQPGILIRALIRILAMFMLIVYPGISVLHHLRVFVQVYEQIKELGV